MLKKKLTNLGGENEEDDEEPKEECSELFESKFVKQIIEAFQTVLEIIEQQENELNDWVGEDFNTMMMQQMKAAKQSKKSKLKAAPKAIKSIISGSGSKDTSNAPPT